MFPFIVLNIINSFNKVFILTIYFNWWGRVLDLSSRASNIGAAGRRSNVWNTGWILTILGSFS